MIDLDEISFAEWLVKLNNVATAKGFRTKESFVSATGQLEWYAAYEAGLNPEQALYVAMMESIEYGHDYGD